MRNFYWVSIVVALFIVGCGGGGGGSSSSTTSSTSGSSTGTLYGANEIVYGVPNPTATSFSLNQVKPDGTSNSVLASGLSPGILLFAQIPGQANQFVMAADLTGAGVFGIYVTTGLSTTVTKTLAPAIYGFVTSLSISPDGKNLVYSAASSTDPLEIGYLFWVPVAGGTATQLDYSDGSALSPADGNSIAYVSNQGGASSVDQVYTRTLSSGSGGKATQITTDSINHLLPAYNRAGTELAYWESATTNALMIKTVGSSAAAVALPNPNQIAPLGESFNSDGSQIAIAGDSSGTGELLTQAASGTSNPVTILVSPQPVGNYGVYWTDTTGRALIGSIMPSAARRRSPLASILRGNR
jgi:hypothetical protein